MPLIGANTKTPALYLLAGSGSVVLTNLAAAQAATGMTFKVLEVFATNQVSWADWEAPWFANDVSQGYTTWVAADPANRQLIVSINLIPTVAGSMADPLTWETTGAAGGFNAHATALAANLVAAGLGYSIIRLGLEMNGNWNCDAVGGSAPGGGTAAMQTAWAQTFAQEVTAMRAVAGAHFQFCWCPNAVVAGVPFAGYYPGDAYVDIIGIDAYDAFANGTQPAASAATTTSLFGQSYGLTDLTAFAVSRGKPLGLGEWGCVLGGADGGLGDDPYYVQGIAAWVAANQVAFHSYFSSATGGIIPLSTTYPLTLNAYKSAFSGTPSGSGSAGTAAGTGTAPRPAKPGGVTANVAEDPSTPPALFANAAAVTSASFSPPAGSTILVLAWVYFSAQAASAADHWTVSDTSTGTWAAGTHIVASADTAAWSGAALLVAEKYFAAAPGPVTVTAANSDTAAVWGTFLAVRVLTGAAASQAGAAVASGSANALTGTRRYAALTTTTPGSLAYALGGESYGAAAYTPVAGTASIYCPLLAGAGNLYYGGFAKAAAVTGTPGAVTIGWNAGAVAGGTDAFAWLAVEVLPAATATAQAGLPAGAGLAPPPAAAVAAPGTPHAGPAAGAGTAPPAAAVVPASATAGPAAGAGAATAPAVSHSTTVTAGSPAGAGSAAAPGNLTVLPPVYMGEARGTGRPVPMPGTSQVEVAPPDGSQWTYLGTIGHVRDLKYSFVMPGGADKMTCTVQVPPAYRHQALSVGWQVRIWRGGHVVWTGRLDEPSPGPVWTLTAVGDGQRAQDFTAIWSGTWPAGQPDDAVSQAIARGLPWVNPGVGQPSWAWFGQQPDSGSQTVAQLLTLVCTRGAGTWYVNSQPGGLQGPDLSLFPIPSVPDRLLLVTTPVARTLGALVNRLVIRYQSAADNTATGTVAAYQVTTVTSTADVAAHQPSEAYLDLSSAGVMSAGAAQAAGNAILAVYQRVSYAGPFTAAPGQLMTVNGQPVDPGCDQAGRVVKAVITDYGYGGEVTPAQPVIFPVGGYEWDDQRLIATLTPFLAVDQSLAGLVSAQQLTVKPVVAVAPTSA